MNRKKIIEAVALAYDRGRRDHDGGDMPNCFRGVLYSGLTSTLAEQAYMLGYIQASYAYRARTPIIGGLN